MEDIASGAETKGNQQGKRTTTNHSPGQQINMCGRVTDGDSPEILYRQELIAPSQSREEAAVHVPQGGDPRQQNYV